MWGFFVTIDLTQIVKENLYFVVLVGFPLFAICLSGIVFLISFGFVYVLARFKYKFEFGKLQIQEKPVSPSKEVEKSWVVYSELALASQALSADLVCVFQLHNGGKYNNGNSVLKFTQSHNYASHGHRNFYNAYVKFTNILISMAPDWIAPTIQYGKYWNNVSEMSEESSWKREFERNSIESFIQVCVKSNGIEEIIVSAFFNRELQEIETEQMYNVISRHSHVIAAMLKEEI